jgi:hypothetical protein
MEYFNHRPVPFFRFRSFPADGVQTHAVFTRQGGVSAPPFAALNLSSAVADARPHIDENRRRAYGVVGRGAGSLVHEHLVHGNGVLRVTAAEQGNVAGRGDGLITDDPGCGLTMNYADCSPIFLYDPQRPAIGLGHAGWQGAVADLPGAMVRAMVAAFGSDPAALYAGIGPSIGVCCYEVDEPLTSRVRGAFDQPASLLPTRPGKRRPHFDLVEANRRNLARAGVTQIELPELCTACRTDLFFSHRAEQGTTGRFGVAFLLRG